MPPYLVCLHLFKSMKISLATTFLLAVTDLKFISVLLWFGPPFLLGPLLGLELETYLMFGTLVLLRQYIVLATDTIS